MTKKELIVTLQEIADWTTESVYPCELARTALLKLNKKNRFVIETVDAWVKDLGYEVPVRKSYFGKYVEVNKPGKKEKEYLLIPEELFK